MGTWSCCPGGALPAPASFSAASCLSITATCPSAHERPRFRRWASCHWMQAMTSDSLATFVSVLSARESEWPRTYCSFECVLVYSSLKTFMCTAPQPSRRLRRRSCDRGGFPRPLRPLSHRALHYIVFSIGGRRRRRGETHAHPRRAAPSAARGPDAVPGPVTAAAALQGAHHGSIRRTAAAGCWIRRLTDPCDGPPHPCCAWPQQSCSRTAGSSRPGHSDQSGGCRGACCCGDIPEAVLLTPCCGGGGGSRSCPPPRHPACATAPGCSTCRASAPPPGLCSRSSTPWQHSGACNPRRAA